MDNNYQNFKEEVEKIILVDVQKEIYPNLEKTFLDTVRNSGYKNLNIDKKPDFEKLYLNNNFKESTLTKLLPNLFAAEGVYLIERK